MAPRKERITPPNRKELSQASKLLKRGSAAGGRVMSEAAVAKKEGVKRRK